MGHRRIVTILIVILSVGCCVYASDVFYVSAEEPNDPGSGTYNDPFGRIQDAIDTAQNGNVIEILPGIYTGVGNFNLDPMGKSITIRGTNPEDEDIVAATIIDPNRLGRGFYLHSGEDIDCIIEGLTIRNAYTGGKGAGIYCSNSNPTIVNCIISDNRAGTHGGGIFCQSSSPKITGCVISGDISANDGGGIEWWSGSSELKNCIIADNEASGTGGGVDLYGCDNMSVSNCTFAANSAYRGGGLCCWSSNCEVTNSIFRGSSVEYSGAEIGIYAGNVTVIYSDIEGGEEAILNVSGNLDWGEGNIDTDPDFASFDTTTEPTTWDFHLQSEFGRYDKNTGDWVEDLTTSLCIDAGDPNSDYSGETWPHGGRINMGAYGGTWQASRNGNIADFDINGSVDGTDLTKFVYYWLDSDGGIVNLDLKGMVNTDDFAIMAENWLWQKQ